MGLQQRSLICSPLGLRRKSTSIHLSPEPPETIPRAEVMPDLTDTELPGYDADQIQIPPLGKESLKIY